MRSRASVGSGSSQAVSAHGTHSIGSRIPRRASYRMRFAMSSSMRGRSTVSGMVSRQLSNACHDLNRFKIKGPLVQKGVDRIHNYSSSLGPSELPGSSKRSGRIREPISTSKLLPRRACVSQSDFITKCPREELINIRGMLSRRNSARDARRITLIEGSQTSDRSALRCKGRHYPAAEQTSMIVTAFGKVCVRVRFRSAPSPAPLAAIAYRTQRGLIPPYLRVLM